MGGTGGTTHRLRVRMRFTRALAFAMSGSRDRSISRRMVSSSWANSSADQMALLMRPFCTTSASVRASTTMNSIALAVLCVYTWGERAGRGELGCHSKVTPWVGSHLIDGRQVRARLWSDARVWKSS